MQWEQAKQLLLEGKKVRRKAWHPGCYIFAGDDSRHILLAGLDRPSTNWQPYWQDIMDDVTDWEEFES